MIVPDHDQIATAIYGDGALDPTWHAGAVIGMRAASVDRVIALFAEAQNDDDIPEEVPVDWVTPYGYDPGDRVLWRGAVLVCGVDHYAGESARHPWDPGWGWRAAKAATLWAPDGENNAELLRLLDVGDGRLQDVLAAATSRAKDETA